MSRRFKMSIQSSFESFLRRSMVALRTARSFCRALSLSTGPSRLLGAKQPKSCTMLASGRLGGARGSAGAAEKTYLIELLVIHVGLDAQELEDRVEVRDRVHHGRASQAPAIGSDDLVGGFGRLRVLVLDALRLVQDDPVPLALAM